jgi:hypothetical protein
MMKNSLKVEARGGGGKQSRNGGMLDFLFNARVFIIGDYIVAEFVACRVA